MSSKFQRPATPHPARLAAAEDLIGHVLARHHAAHRRELPPHMEIENRQLLAGPAEAA